MDNRDDVGGLEMGNNSSVVKAWYKCRDCGQESESMNAMANGKRHADAKGHRVDAYEVIKVEYR